MNRLAALLVASAAIAMATSCSDSGPELGDVRAEAFLVYPGATELARSWLPEEHGRSIDGHDLSHPARLTIRYQLPEPLLDREAIFAWYEERLIEAGWAHRDVPFHNAFIVTRQVADRTHTVEVEVGDGRIDESQWDYSVRYSIGYSES